MVDVMEKPIQDVESEMDILKIMEKIPHRPPFLLVDRITEHVYGQWARGYKNITINEPFFDGHFPGRPIMPGVLIVEAIAQMGSIVASTLPQAQGKIALFGGMDKVRFRKQVVPGDKLELYTELTKLRSSLGKAIGHASVNGEVVAEAEFTFYFVPHTAQE